MHLAMWGHLASDWVDEGGAEGIVRRCKDVGVDTYLAYVNPIEKGKLGGRDVEADRRFTYNTSLYQHPKVDYLGPLTEAATAEGVEVQPWLLSFRPHLLEGETSEEVFSRVYAPLGYDDSKADVAGFAFAGKRLCPTWPENRARALRMLDDFLTHHPNLSGIHMDYMRYGDRADCFEHPCHCAACRAQYRRHLAQDTVTADDLKQPAFLYEFVKIRNRVIRGLVEAIRERTQAAGMTLTLAARADYYDWAVLEGQDWGEWANDGLLDRAYMMNYWTDEARHNPRMRVGIELTRNAKTLYIDGVGKGFSGGVNTTAQMEKNIRDAMDAGAQGISIFAWMGMKAEDWAMVKRIKQEYSA